DYYCMLYIGSGISLF
nr:immunoglobulin light chain junction region [Macaca mulatta]MOX71507.1 immunoglobulin light chain junction region [Macaca mulatta]MOX72117.1 immunoglobulin light chain junction region [Macaca mulatta]MOX72172.1 immunoglobulin light chain junction region [Macaca mulatta]MOX72250.1 immunoglobulin light chain junction region [Macaca mulatta]